MERIILVGTKGVPVLACSAVDGVVTFVSPVRAAHFFQLDDTSVVSARSRFFLVPLLVTFFIKVSPQFCQ